VVGEMVRDVCFGNAARHFNVKLSEGC
jgi:hypothetical protein